MGSLFWCWLKQRSKKPAGLLGRQVLLVFILAVLACDTQATASSPLSLAPTPTPASEPTVIVPTPTYVAAPTGPTGGTPIGTPFVPGPAFADYWNPPADFYGEPTYGGTLRIGFYHPLEHGNVRGAASPDVDIYRAPTGATLVMEDPYDPRGPVIPDLARRWEIHGGQDGVTFQFREGTTWHSGEPFTCEDARFSLETMITGHGLTDSYMQDRLAHILPEEMTCLDDMTLEIDFTGPTAIPLHSLSNSRALVFNKAWFQAGGEDVMFADASMGIGPFRWAEGQEVGECAAEFLESSTFCRMKQRFERNEDYFISELPYVDELVIHSIVDDSARQAAHLAHQTDWLRIKTALSDNSWGNQYQAFVDHDQIMTVIHPTGNHFRIWINTRNEPFNNVQVRQAIVMGIDRGAAIQDLVDGHGSTGGFGYPPGSQWELPDEQVCSVPGWCVSKDIEATRAEARAILEAEGFDFDEIYVISALSDQEIYHATFLHDQLLQLGIKTDIDTLGTRMRLRTEYPRDFYFTLGGVPSRYLAGGAENYLRCDSAHRFNASIGVCDETIDALLDQAEVEPDLEKRLALAHQTELAAMRQYSSFPLYWEMEGAAFWPEVRGYVHFPDWSGSYRKFNHMWIDPGYMGDAGYAGQTTGVPGGIW